MSHSVNLTWTASTDSVDGYNVLRSTVSGGPYVQVNTALVTVDSFTDVGPFSNLGPFFYVAQSVKGTTLSIHSNETPAVFLPPLPPTLLLVASVS
jgi:hypothetical protein